MCIIGVLFPFAPITFFDWCHILSFLRAAFQEAGESLVVLSLRFWLVGFRRLFLPVRLSAMGWGWSVWANSSWSQTPKPCNLPVAAFTVKAWSIRVQSSGRCRHLPRCFVWVYTFLYWISLRQSFSTLSRMDYLQNWSPFLGWAFLFHLRSFPLTGNGDRWAYGSFTQLFAPVIYWIHISNLSLGF